MPIQDPIEKTIERTLEQLRLKLQTSYKLPPGEPTDEQLFAIIGELVGKKNVHGPITNDDFFAAVEGVCPGGMRMTYQGMDLTDVNALLSIFQRQMADNKS